jgi:aspartate kinase
MIVMNLGGTSGGNPERIKNVFSIVKNSLDRKPIVVVSAVGGVTDLLIQAGKDAIKGNLNISKIEEKHHKIISELNLPADIIEKEMTELKNLLMGISMLKEISPKTSDYLVSFGERMSCQLVAKYLSMNGVESRHHFAYDIGFITDDIHQDAELLDSVYSDVENNLKDLNHVPVVTGFIAKTKSGSITTLGRGGSDYTAAVIGASVGAEEVQVWTDVDGMMTTDPSTGHGEGLSTCSSRFSSLGGSMAASTNMPQA